MFRIQRRADPLVGGALGLRYDPGSPSWLQKPCLPRCSQGLSATPSRFQYRVGAVHETLNPIGTVFAHSGAFSLGSEFALELVLYACRGPLLHRCSCNRFESSYGSPGRFPYAAPHLQEPV